MAHHIHKPKYIYRKTIPVPEDTPRVRGYDFNQGVDHRALLQSYLNTGFQATNFGLAIQQINSMIKRRQQPLKAVNGSVDEDPSTCPCLQSCTIFLGYTSNLISSGVRESIRYLAEHRMVDVLVTTAGGIEEDLIKCLGPVYIGDFTLPGKDLFKKGLDRIGNLLMPDENYAKFDKWMTPILKQMLVEQNTQGARWTPSKMIHRLGKEIDNPESVCYWAYKNNIPVFSPALTDGGIGDMLYLFSAENPGLILDITEDITKVNNMAVAANSTGMIILGGGVAKHHICNANAWRMGAAYAVYVNTAQEADGSDSGARPDEAVTWGKITTDAEPVKNNIPVFSPALTDGGIGDMLYLFSAENPGLILDITEDITKVNNMAVAANSTGMIILEGGVAKHHICNANAWRMGAAYAVYVNTAQEADGSDSGARPDEAVTWGKITTDAEPVKVFGDATIIFPLVAETFAVHADNKLNGEKQE